jgi:WD40 repeat protein/formylglycine-generating enzyme required for sulfatase activity
VSLDPITRLVGTLRRAGLDCDGVELAEVLWLARFIPETTAHQIEVVQPEAENEQVTSEAQDSALPPPADSGTDSKHPPSTQSPAGARLPSNAPPPLYLYAPTASEDRSEPVTATATQIISGSSLPGALALGRALRPLIRCRKSRFVESLDEEGTAERSAGGSGHHRRIIPVFQPGREQLFDAALVIDDSSAMGVWRKTLQTFQRLLERHRAFRDVRAWRLRFSPKVTLTTNSGREVRPETLLDPGGQRLIILVTQATHPGWLESELTSWLWTWAANGPVAMAHVLPDRLWKNTGLGKPSAKVQARRTGGPNTVLRVEAPRWYANGPPTLAVPVFSLEPASMVTWALMLMGVRQTKAPAFLFEQPENVEEVDLGSPDAIQSPEDQVALFQKHSTPEAFDLACSLAAFDFNLPVMRLTQQAILGARASQTQLAEVLLSGLLEYAEPALAALAGETQTTTAAEAKTQSDPETLLYRIKSDVQPELDSRAPLRSATSILWAMARHIEERLGAPVDLATFIPDAAGSQQLPNWARPFATAGATLAQQLGLTRQPEPIPRPVPGQPSIAVPEPDSNSASDSFLSPSSQNSTLRPPSGSANFSEAPPTQELSPESSTDSRAESHEFLTLARTFVDAAENMRRIAWSPDGTQIASAGFDRLVKVRTVQTGDLLHTLTGHTGTVYGLSWSPDGTRLASGSQDGSVRIWDLVTGKSRHILHSLDRSVLGVAWSPDGALVAAGNDGGTVKIWEVSTEILRFQSQSHKAPVHSVAWSLDGQSVVSAANDGTVRMYSRLERWRYASAILDTHKSQMYGVAWSRNGTIAAAGSDGVIYLYDRAGRPSGTLAGHAAPVTDLSFSWSGTQLASISWDHTVRVWNSQQQTLSTTLSVTSAHRFHCGVAFQPTASNQLAIAAQAASAIEIWQPAGAPTYIPITVSGVQLTRLHEVLVSIGMDPEQASRLQTAAPARLAEEILRRALDNATALNNLLRFAQIFAGAQWSQVFIQHSRGMIVVAELSVPSDQAFHYDYPNQTGGLIQRAIRERSVVWAPAVHLEPDYISATPGTDAELVIPLLSSDGTTLVGLINMEFPVAEALTIGQRKWLQEFWMPLATRLESRAHTVFLAVADQDEHVAEEVADRLREVGFSVWLSSAVARFCAKGFRDEHVALEKSTVLIALLSESYTGSLAAQKDLNFAMRPEHGIRVVPIVTDDSRIPRKLNDLERFDFRKNSAVSLQWFIRLLQSLTNSAVSLGTDWIVSSATARRTWHPQVDIWNRGDISACTFTVHPDFEKTGARRWIEWGDLLVALDAPPNQDHIYLLPSRSAPTSVRDPTALASSIALREMKRRLTREFAVERPHKRLKGVWFFKTMSDNVRRVHVYSEEYDSYLQERLSSELENRAAVSPHAPLSDRSLPPFSSYPLVDITPPPSVFYRDDPNERHGEFVVTRGQHTLQSSGPFRMGQYPVTNQLFLQFVAAGCYTDGRFWGERHDHFERFLTQDGKTYGPSTWPSADRFPVGRDNHPVTGISFLEARAFIRWLQATWPQPQSNWELPSEDMWEVSARSPQGLVYPWGNEFLEDRCNSAEAGLRGTSEVGRFSQGHSVYQCADLAGNVWEFVTARDGFPSKCVLRGGSYKNNRYEVRSYLRLFNVPDSHRAEDFGFRCALVPRSSAVSGKKKAKKKASKKR